MHDTSHPLIILYEETGRENFPLVLFVGREPNNNAPYDDYVGPYDFYETPHCGFWNVAYKIVAESQNMTVGELKELCFNNRSSILAFTNITPIPILHRVKSKDTIRKEISREESREHIEKIFSKDIIIKRVELIVLSGLDRKEFSEPLEFFVKMCEFHKKHFIQLPFFFPLNYPQIREKIIEEDINKIKTIYSRWFDQVA